MQALRSLTVTACVTAVATGLFASTPSAEGGPAPKPLVSSAPVVSAELTRLAPLRSLGRSTPPSAARVQALLDPLLTDPALGARVSGQVVDVSSGRVLYSHGATAGVMPASTVKTLVATAALATLGPTAHLQTRALATGPVKRGVLSGDLVLQGGGDATLSARRSDTYPTPTRVQQLARAVRRAGITQVTGRLLADGGLYSGPQQADGWRPSYGAQGVVSPVSALEIDLSGWASHGRPQTPELSAVAAFRTALAEAGVSVTGPTVVERAPKGSVRVASVDSARVGQLVERMLADSDNDLAESLGRQVALHEKEPATFTGAVTAVTTVLSRLGVPVKGVTLHDLSGLSRLDAVPPATVVSVLRLAAAPGHPELRAVVTGLPVAGLSGTLAGRYHSGSDGSAGGGRVRAKTGYLDGVGALAGVVVDPRGRLLAFDFVASAAPARSVVEAALDRAAAALATCTCR